jgi:hypothetical protein
MSSRVRARVLAVSLVCSVLTTSDVSKAAESGALRRWAVVGDQTVHESGLSELVMAELSQSSSIELVEREELQLASRELEISSLHLASESAGRLQLGALIKADGLALLSLGRHGGKSFIRVVTCDCDSGARLAYEQLLYSEARVDRIVRDIAAVVAKTRAHFPTGVHRIVTVSPFLSQNFTHDFDYLQDAGAAWLSEVIARQPGLAVVELDEAQAIGREMSLFDGELAERHRPLFVSGEFTTKYEQDSQTTNVEVSISARDGKSIVVSLKSLPLPEQDLTVWLAEAAGTEILKQLNVDDGIQQPISRAKQFLLLAERGERFSKFGSFAQSIGLREAALLLKRDPELELELLRDYFELARIRFEAVMTWVVARRDHTRTGRPVEEFEILDDWELRCQRDLHLYRARLAHTERLVRVSEIAGLHSNELLRMVTVRHPDVRFVRHKWSDVQTTRDTSFWRVLRGLGDHYRSEMVRLASVPESPTAQTQKTHLVRTYDAWIANATSYVFGSRGATWERGVRQRWGSDDTLPAFRRLIDKSLLPDCPCSRLVRLFVSDRGYGLSTFMKQGKFRETDLIALQNELLNSPNEVLQFYGRCLQSSRRWESLVSQSDFDQSMQQAELAELDKWAQQWGRRHRAEFEFAAQVSGVLRGRQLQLERTPKPLTGSKWPATRRPITGSDPGPSLRFEKLDFVPDWTRLTRCTPTFDVVWSATKVGRLEGLSSPVSLFEANLPTDEIRQVVWDGKYLWIGTRSFGVRVMSQDGQVIAEFPQGKQASTGQTGLPAWELDRMTSKGHFRIQDTDQGHGFRLHSVSPGRCLVTGRYGELRRRWTALLELQNDEWQVHVLHEAIALPESENLETSRIEVVYEPRWTLTIPPLSGPYASRVLIGRGQFNNYSIGRPPLLIDIASRQVNVLDGEFPLTARGHRRRSVLVGNRIVVPTNDGCQILRIDSDDPAKWTSKVVTANDRWAMSSRSWQRPLVVEDDVIFPGRVWWRLQPETGIIEAMTPSPLASSWVFEENAVSGPLGLLAWNRGDNLYRVHVGEDSTERATISDDFPFVPQEGRVRHRHAVSRLRKLGATVETSWAYFPYSQYQSGSKKEWSTFVWIPETWRGKVADIALLEDLYNVRRLALVGASVDDRCCNTIAKLGRLQQLTFEQTQVTDIGLKQLGRLPFLAELRLQCKSGSRKFTNKAIAAISVHPLLERLIVFGPQFTDEALTMLPKRRIFHEVSLLDTSVSDDAIARLKAERRDMIIEQRIENRGL